MGIGNKSSLVSSATGIGWNLNNTVMYFQRKGMPLTTESKKEQ